MKKSLFSCILGSILILNGCVSNDQYSAINKQESLEKDLSVVKESISKLQSENDSLKQKLTLYRGEANPNGPKNDNYNTTAEQEYIDNLLSVYDFEARYYDSLLDGKVPGVTFKIKNKGEKTLKDIEVTVYFKDDNGKPIAEEKYHPVNGSSIYGYKELKPNYTFQIEKDHFYTGKTTKRVESWKCRC